jgi:hypothetical protein
MQVNGYPDFLEIVLFPTETELLRSILHEIHRAYAIPSDQLESSVRSVWFSGEGFRSAEMTDEDIQEWNQALYEFRGQNRIQCHEWMLRLAQGGDPLLWRIEKDEADTLLTILNDYRLYQAARNHIGQAEMERDFAFVESAAQRMALMEIHFLDWLIEMLLRGMGMDDEES